MKRKRLDCEKNAGNMLRLQTVPWFSRAEWMETFEKAYSKEKSLQESAYTQMCIWKTRYPNLPLGVECTMSMLHVKLCDNSSETCESTYKDKDLQLLYSTAVMRFLNHLSVMSSYKDSMYKVAEQHKLPDWLINLRHEAAHGNSVPALYLLRQAGDIIFQWLKENYWEAEADVMTDVFNEQLNELEKYCKDISELLDLWVVLKISHWSGYKTLHRIPFENYRDAATELLTKEAEKAEKSVDQHMQSKEETLKSIYTDPDKNNVSSSSESGEEETMKPKFVKIKSSFEPVLMKLISAPLKRKNCKKIQYKHCLISCLLKNKAFCPEFELENFDESEALQMMSLLAELWKELLESLQTHRLLHELLRALLAASDSQLPAAQLWLRLLTQLLSGDPPPQPPGSESVCTTLARNLPCVVDPKILLQKANLHHIKHQRPISLKSASAQEIDVLQQLAQKVLETPTSFSSTYLKCLLRYWDSPLSNTTVQKLSALVQLYSGAETVNQEEYGEVHTVASLMDQALSVKEDTPQDTSTGPWKLYTVAADWSKCPLGLLPWESEDSFRQSNIQN